MDNNDAKIALARDEPFCKKMVELFRHSDSQVLHCVRAQSCVQYDAGIQYSFSCGDAAQVSKHALGLASEVCCRNIEAKELFCNEYRMVCTRLHALSLLVFLMIEIQQFLISMVVEMNAADVAAARLDARAIRWIF